MTRWLLLAVALALQACAVPRALPQAEGLEAGAGEVVVIGKIELVPPLDPRYEQKSHWNVVGEKRMLDRIWMSTGAQHLPVTTSQLDASQFQASLEVPWGVPFMVRAPRQRTYLNGGVTHLDVLQQDRLWFPGGLYFDIPAGARAVYIGTLRYHRNDFNAITRMDVVDERRDIATVLKGASAAEVPISLLKRVR